MNKPNIIHAGFTMLLLLAAASVSAQNSGSYANVQIALPDVSGFSGGLSLIGTYGMPMNKLMPNAGKELSIEAELTTTVTNPDTTMLGLTYEASYFTLAGYGVYTMDLNPQFAVRGRAGLLFESVDIEGQFGTGSETGFGLSLGVGAVYKLGGTMNLVAEYTIIESDISHLSAGIQMKF